MNWGTHWRDQGAWQLVTGGTRRSQLLENLLGAGVSYRKGCQAAPAPGKTPVQVGGREAGEGRAQLLDSPSIQSFWEDLQRIHSVRVCKQCCGLCLCWSTTEKILRGNVHIPFGNVCSASPLAARGDTGLQQHRLGWASKVCSSHHEVPSSPTGLIPFRLHHAHASHFWLDECFSWT